MFESIIAYVLNKYLSGYIGEVDYRNLSLGLYSGKYTPNLNEKIFFLIFLDLNKLYFHDNIYFLGKLELKNVKIQPSALVNLSDYRLNIVNYCFIVI